MPEALPNSKGCGLTTAAARRLPRRATSAKASPARAPVRARVQRRPLWAA
jgi:hypothetical protein